MLAEQERQAEEERRLAREREEAEWRAAFRPHAIIQTERTVPSQITICGLTGGARRWLWIGFDLSKPPVTFVQQALAAMPDKARRAENGKRYVTFFGEALGFIVNYSRIRRSGSTSTDDCLKSSSRPTDRVRWGFQLGAGPSHRPSWLGFSGSPDP